MLSLRRTFFRPGYLQILLQARQRIIISEEIRKAIRYVEISVDTKNNDSAGALFFLFISFSA